MARALELARQAPFTNPNPKVGAVVVRDGRVVSEGFHRGAGTAHAEADALTDADATGATLYVTLEPCVHHGLTPPCAPAIVDAGITRVVVALIDPDPRVSGRGVAYLQAHAVEVVTGVLEGPAALLNAAFLHRCATGMPLLSLKLALTLDGKLAAADGSSRWITGEDTRREVHRRRLEADAVMVGAGTVIADDPELTVRAVPAPRQPARVIVDAVGRVDPSARALRGRGAILATTDACPHDTQTAYKEAGAEVVVLPAGPGGVDLAALAAGFAARGWTEVLCEGGAALATSLLAADLVDLLELHYGPVLVGEGPALGELGVATMSEARRFRTAEVRRSGDDAVVRLLKEAGR